MHGRSHWNPANARYTPIKLKKKYSIQSHGKYLSEQGRNVYTST